MAEIRTVTTLRYKREEILHFIRLYKRQIEQARSDLARVTASDAPCPLWVISDQIAIPESCPLSIQ